MDRIRRFRPTLCSNERGLALAMALFAILVIGALVTGIFFAGRMEMVSGRNSVYMAQATEAAEKGLADAFSGWNTAWNGYGVDGDSVQATQSISGATNVRYTNTVRRLQGGNYLITSVGEKLDRGGNVIASRLLARLGKLVPTAMNIQAAFTSKGATSLSGSTTVTGVNTTPALWTACAGPDVAAVRSDAAITKGGAAQWYGTPSPPIIQNDPSVTAATFTGPYNALAASTTISYPSSNGPSLSGLAPSVTGSPSHCNPANTNNWGEPNRGGGSVTQCQSYFPIIHFANAPGNGSKVTLNGNSRGQGIILVDGDIRINGNFQFDGIVIALGSIDIQGNADIHGAILALNSGGGSSSTGNGAISYSVCAINAVLGGTATAFALNERSWAQVNPR